MRIGTLLFVIGGLLIYLAAAYWVDLDQVLASATRLDMGVWGVVLGLSLINYALRFGRWHVYLRSLGHPVPMLRHLAIYLAGFALTATPGKVGEGVRAILLHPFGVKIGRSLSMLMAERLLDLIAVSLLATLLFLAPIQGAPWLPLLGAGGTLLILAALHPAVLAWFERFSQRLPSERLHHLGIRLSAFRRDLMTLIRGRLLAGGLVIGLVAWLAEGVGLFLVAEALGVQIGMGAAIGIYATAMLAGALSFLPGGLGSADAAMTALLVFAGAPMAAAVATTILVRLATLWFAIALGGVAWLGLVAWPKSALAADLESEQG